MRIFDNINEIVRDDLQKTIKSGSKVSIAAAYFSMYAFNELKNQLESIDEFRFIFTSPTFITKKAEKQASQQTNSTCYSKGVRRLDKRKS